LAWKTASRAWKTSRRTGVLDYGTRLPKWRPWRLRMLRCGGSSHSCSQHRFHLYHHSPLWIFSRRHREFLPFAAGDRRPAGTSGDYRYWYHGTVERRLPSYRFLCGGPPMCSLRDMATSGTDDMATCHRGDMATRWTGRHWYAYVVTTGRSKDVSHHSDSCAEVPPCALCETWRRLGRTTWRHVTGATWQQGGTGRHWYAYVVTTGRSIVVSHPTDSCAEVPPCALCET